MNILCERETTTFCQSEERGLDEFLDQWDINYKNSMSQIDLFKPELTSGWNLNQKQLFSKLLYHQRAHFDDVLWYVGSFGPNNEFKEMIIENTKDEFGFNGISHEKLYLEFANSLGVDLKYELLDQKYYLKFLKEYNHGHLRWLRDHDSDHMLAAFSAIERLDNLDYLGLKNVALSIGLSGKALVFFNVHIYVKHYEQTETIFKQLWKKRPEVVKGTFNFIAEYQLEIWRKISDAIFNGYHLEDLQVS